MQVSKALYYMGMAPSNMQCALVGLLNTTENIDGFRGGAPVYRVEGGTAPSVYWVYDIQVFKKTYTLMVCDVPVMFTLVAKDVKLT